VIAVREIEGIKKGEKKEEGTREVIDYEDSERNTKGGHDEKLHIEKNKTRRICSVGLLKKIDKKEFERKMW
jgi:hypothetical protein